MGFINQKMNRRYNNRNRRAIGINIRLPILAACLGWIITQKYLKSRLLPHGPAQKMEWEDRPTYAAVDKTNDSLQAKHGKLQKIFERVEKDKPRLLKGPETVFFDDNGVMYTTTDDANLITLTDFQTEADGKITAKTTLLADVVGRPLGAKFTGDTLYMADAALGLTRIRNPHDPKSKLELVATTVKDGGKETRIQFADDLAIGPKTGMVYFTDASEVYPERDRNFNWDVMYASTVEGARGPSGRLLQYDPSTDEVAVLARGLWFANGVAVDKEENYLVFVETFKLRIAKYFLAGDKQGTIEYIVNGDPSPAYIDGIDCAWKGVTGESSYCYAVCPSVVVPAHKLLWRLPHPIDMVLRTMVMIMPKWLTPKAKPYGGVIVVDPESSSYVELIQDPHGAEISQLTGVTVHDNKLYLGSLHNDFLGVYDLL